MKQTLGLPIREVYQSNFSKEMKNISKILKKFNYVGMDTEFPGTPFSSNLNSYKAIKQNVDSLKLIQVGISLADKFGNKPEECGTWQFNLRFSLKTDKYSQDSINMLTSSGIDFNELEKEGISQELFAEYLLSSGLVLNEDVKWVCFHGVYDFAYFLHTITNLPLPETEVAFFNDLKIYFPCFFDIRYLIRYNENMHGSLSKLAQDLNVKRIGNQHQAGSDSLLTIGIFIKLFQDEYVSEEYAYADRNCLFGLSPNDSSLNLEQKRKEYGQSNGGMQYDYSFFQPSSLSQLSMNSNVGNQRGGGYHIQGNNNQYYHPYHIGMQYQMMNQQESSSASANLFNANVNDNSKGKNWKDNNNED